MVPSGLKGRMSVMLAHRWPFMFKTVATIFSSSSGVTLFLMSSTQRSAPIACIKAIYQCR
jgi:hypothetical protein